MRGEDPPLNPAQAETLARLGRPGKEAEPPEVDPALAGQLRAHLDAELDPLLAGIDPDRPLFVSKYLLTQLHGCETRYVGTAGDAFTWTVPLARGSVSHKAIELTLNWPGEPVPAELVDEAMARLEQQTGGVGDFLRTCTDADRAELRGQANDRVAKFVECFPPLRSSWRPVVESRITTDLAGGRLTLQGRVDLTLGQPLGHQPRKVIIDLKTGGYGLTHREDLRFYALVETLRIGVPPRLVASYYLDAARAETETITPGHLDGAARRVAVAVERLLTLEATPEAAITRPGPACRWCSLIEGCEPGRAFLDDRDDPERWDDDT